MIEYQYSGGKWRTQPNCHGCRAVMPAKPKRPTGPNRNKAASIRGAVFGSQKKVTDYASN